MKVALISTAWKMIPPNGYGGTENVLASLLAGSKNLDIDFELFTVGESAETQDIQILNSRVRTHWFFEKEMHDEIGNEATKVWVEALHALRAWDVVNDNQPDIIHDHSGIGFSMIARSVKARPPVLITLHGPLDIPLIQDFYRLLAKAPRIYFNSISDSQRKGLPDLSYIGTVYNGIKVDDFPFSEKKDEYLLIIGRVTPVKGQKEAIEVAKASGKTLVIAGSIEGIPTAKDYWEASIKPYIDKDLSRRSRKVEKLESLIKVDGPPRVIYFGEADSREKKFLYAHAEAMLMPILWEEPFGMVIIESMVCGTPVIAFNRGAVSEIVVPGETGFLTENVRDMVQAVDNLSALSSRSCRERVERCFSERVMAENYSRLYEKIVNLDEIN